MKKLIYIVCCIYHKPRPVGESSSESESSDSNSSDSDSDNEAGHPRRGLGHSHHAQGSSSGNPPEQVSERERVACCSNHHGHGKERKRRKPSPNAYEKMPKPEKSHNPKSQGSWSSLIRLGTHWCWKLFRHSNPSSARTTGQACEVSWLLTRSLTGTCSALFSFTSRTVRLTFAVAETANALVHALVQQSMARGQKLLGSHVETHIWIPAQCLANSMAVIMNRI